MRPKRVIPALLVLTAIALAVLLIRPWHKDNGIQKVLISDKNGIKVWQSIDNTLKGKVIARDYNDKSKLPMSCKTMGATLTLKEIKMLPGGYIKAILVLDLPEKNKMPAPIVTGDGKIFGADARLLGLESFYKGDNYKKSQAGQRHQMIIGQKYQLANKSVYVDRVSIVQELHYDRMQKHVRFKFSNFSPSDLPLSKSSRGAKVTLDRFINGAANETYGEFTDLKGKQMLGLVMTEDCPDGYISEGISLFTQKGSEMYCTLSSGASYEVYNEVPTATLNAAVAATRPNLKERVVGAFSSSTADAMKTKRVSNTLKSKWVGKPIPQPGLYAYALPKPYPQKFTCRWSCILPSDKKDVIWVKFDNVPVKPLD